jgi:hypothetical protein
MITKAAAVDSWAFLLKPWVWQALLSFQHSAKHALPHLSFSESGQDGNQGSTLAFRSLCSVLYRSLTTKKKRKGIGRQSREYSVFGLTIRYISIYVSGCINIYTGGIHVADPKSHQNKISR